MSAAEAERGRLGLKPETGFLDPEGIDALLRRYDLGLARHALVQDSSEAVEAADQIGFPIALKGINPAVVHKQAGGLVALGLKSRRDTAVAAEAIVTRGGPGTRLLVQEMVPAGLEIIVGARRDPVFGPVVLAGLGGIYTEILDDVSVRLAPIDEHEAGLILDGLRAGEMLAARDWAGATRRELARVIGAVSRLVCGEPQVAELDLNPVVVSERGALAVDARVKLSSSPPAGRSRTPSRQDLERLLSPRSIAVIGASRDESKQGARLVRQLVANGFDGQVYPVNPEAGAIYGIPAYKSIEHVPAIPDLACVLVPAAAVAREIAACARAGVTAAIVFSSGFGEAGCDGVRFEREVSEAARKGGVALCGPNTAGIANFHRRTAITTAMSLSGPVRQPGSIALVTQSGALGSSILSRGWDLGVGFSHWICVGNQIDVAIGDFMEHLAEDSEVAAIVMFLESVGDYASFRRGAEAARAAGKPVLALKTGRSAVGKAAVRSHSAALAGDDRIYDTVFRDCGVVRVGSLQTLIDGMAAFATRPAKGGPRLGVVSTSGAACGLIADEADRLGLELPPLPPEVHDAVASVIPSYGSSNNPVDVTMRVTEQPELPARVGDILSRCAQIDTVVICLTTNADPPATRAAESIIRMAQRSAKPCVVARIGAESLAPRALELYRESGMPVFATPERAVAVARAFADYAEMSDAVSGGR